MRGRAGHANGSRLPGLQTHRCSVWSEQKLLTEADWAQQATRPAACSALLQQVCTDSCRTNCTSPLKRAGPPANSIL